jgi:hypothetical protein
MFGFPFLQRSIVYGSVFKTRAPLFKLLKIKYLLVCELCNLELPEYGMEIDQIRSTISPFRVKFFIDL